MGWENKDRWAEWMLKNRFSGDKKAWKAAINTLLPVRDQVIENAGIKKAKLCLMWDAAMG